MRAISRHFFQDRNGEWHQPGSVADFDEDEAVELERRGAIKIIETAMIEPPETRVVTFRKKRQGGAK
jgi:hypothetical protein